MSCIFWGVEVMQGLLATIISVTVADAPFLGISALWIIWWANECLWAFWGSDSFSTLPTVQDFQALKNHTTSDLTKQSAVSFL